MEIALEPALPTYAGGLGILAGDTLRALADLDVNAVGVTLLHRQGYFRQRLDARGRQVAEAVSWRPEDFLECLPERVQVEVGGRLVHLAAWCYLVRGIAGTEVAVYLLDANLPENSREDSHLTDTLYGGDDATRLAQEIVLGVGGVRMLRALGYDAVRRFHLNEGHAARCARARGGRADRSRSSSTAHSAACPSFRWKRRTAS